MEIKNVLSYFDGMSNAQLALHRAGHHNFNYFAAEVDKYAIAVTQKNFADTFQIGDVTKINANDLPKIDLFVGGSPCQGFSFAGKQLNFDDPRSRLFFEFAKMLKILQKRNPDIKFLLENVIMKKEYAAVISEYLGVFPQKLNSSLVSAQNRERFYWSNICVEERGFFAEKFTNFPIPTDKKLFIKDIIETNVDKKYFLSQKMIDYLFNRPKNYNNGKEWDGDRFDTILLDPPYAYRKSMEMYNGIKASPFRQLKDELQRILKPNGLVITFGYHSNTMGKNRGFDVERIALFSHGGAIHDTIASVERHCT